MNGFLLLAGSSVALLGSQSTKITLQEAIQRAEAHSTAVRSAQSAVKTSKARLGEQSSRSLPHVSLDGAATRYDDKTTVTLPGAGSFEIMPDHQEQLGIVLAQDFDISGQIGASISQARLGLMASQYAAQASIEDEALNATSAYYGVLHAAQGVQVAQAALDDYQEQLRTTTKLFQGGVGQKIDVDRSQSQVADAERELTARQNDLDSAQSTLNDLVGNPLDTKLSLEPILNGSSYPQTSNRPALIAKAMDKRPEALAATVEVAAAKKGIQIARGANGPSLTMSLSGYHYPSTSFVSPRENVGALTFSLSIPVFDGGLGREQVSEAKSLVETAEADQDHTRRQIALQVQNAALDVDTAKKRLDAAQVAESSADQARKLAQQRYEAQVGLYLEVTDAQAALTAAQSAVNDATYDLLTAEARLARAINDPIVP
jgi:outer membrane protein